MPFPQTTTVPSRRERERDSRRRQMLAAASHAFAEKGYAGATLDEIASAAEFGKGTLYNYFPGGKEEILFAVFDELYDGLHGISIVSFQDSDSTNPEKVKQQFTHFIQRCFEYYEDRAELFLILTKEAYRMVFSANEERVSYFLGQRERLISTITPPIQAAMDAGVIQRSDPRAVAHMVLGNIQGYQMHRCIRGARPNADLQKTAPPQPAADEAARFVATMLFDGLLVRPAKSHSPAPL